MLPLDESSAVGQATINISVDIIATILNITVVAWSKVITIDEVSPTMLEPKISGYLRRAMTSEKNSRPGLKSQLRIEPEVGTLSSSDSVEPEGRIDIKIIYSFDEEEYFGMECKRVSSRTTGKDRELAKKYITEGIVRFVNGIYCPRHGCAAMLGFVIDGNTKGCIDRICDRLEQRKEESCIEECLIEENNFGEYSNLYRTRHRQNKQNSSINLLHLFLSWE
ncbi:MAG: hypothetical protein RH949_13790 [Coleofasciculus sp. A1-SPW-01]|uniref:hypothetical protein n=1 Tax=Coleofasciculus sp. A1-SPW-01 TaxID=3070819 RepID=UPI003300B84F